MLARQQRVHEAAIVGLKRLVAGSESAAASPAVLGIGRGGARM